MNLIELFYTILFVASVVLSLMYANMWHKHFSVNFSILFTLIPIINLGYMLSSRVHDVDSLILTVKIIYLGGCYLILFITFYIFNMCQIKLKKYIITGMLTISTLLYTSVLTIGYEPYFYKEYTPVLRDGVLTLDKVYGPMHTVFYIVVIVYFTMGFAAINYSLVRKNHVSRRIILYLYIPEAVAFVSYFSVKIFPLDVELTPLAYVFSQIMYLLIARYICIYNTEDTATDIITKRGRTGFISFDFKVNYLGSNLTARDIFPELDELTVDKSLTESKKLSELFYPWIKEFNEDNTKDKYYYTYNGRIYLVDINFMYHNGTAHGFQFIISDDTKNQEYIKLINNYNSDLEKEVKKKTDDIISMHNNLIKSMAMLVESRDNSTGGHIVRTSDVVELLMNEIMKDDEFIKAHNITESFRQNIIKAAPLHDIGKIAVDDVILKKPGRFTDEEFEKMKAHAPEGARVLHSILEGTDDEEFKTLAENVAHYHHERMDGSGYPKGLVGDAIPLEARIMAIADVYDALVSKRVYKESMSFEKADSIMMESMGKHFDPELLKFYLAAKSNIENYYKNT